MKKNYQPLNKHIIVELIEESEEVGGLIKPKQYETKTDKGTVVLSYDGCEVQRGTIVYFNQYSPTEIHIEGKLYAVLKLEDIVVYEK